MNRNLPIPVFFCYISLSLSMVLSYNFGKQCIRNAPRVCFIVRTIIFQFMTSKGVSIRFGHYFGRLVLISGKRCETRLYIVCHGHYSFQTLSQYMYILFNAMKLFHLKQLFKNLNILPQNQSITTFDSYTHYLHNWQFVTHINEPHN